jgi:hypothetical protein
MSYNKGEQPKWSQDIYSPLKKHIDDISQLDYNVEPQYFSNERQKLEQVLAEISRNAINNLK